MALSSLWAVSVGLAGVALLIMCGLIFARLLAHRRDGALAARRRILIPLLLGDASDETVRAAVAPGSPILNDLAIELIQLVRGEERARFVATSTRLGVTDQLRRTLARASVRARMVAAETLAHFPDPLTTDALEAALEDKSADVRFAAALSLASSDRAPDARRLVNLLGLGTREQSMLIVALFQEISRTRPGEIHALIDDAQCPPTVKVAAIEALAASGDYSLVPSIVALALAADPAGEELPRYLRALGAFQHPAAAPAIVRWLGAPTSWVRSAAAEAAGRVGLVGTADTLIVLLDDPDWWVRFRAGEALVRLGESGRRLLVECSHGGTELARSAAHLTLAEHAVRT